MKLTAAIALLSTLTAVSSAATAGCGKSPSTIKAGVNTVTVNGKTREWILTLPTNYNNTRPYRLIFGIHWLTGNMTDVSTGRMINPYYGLQALSNETAIFVSPNGLNTSIGTGWPNTGGEDITLMQAILNATNDNLCINEKLRFSTGFSYGAAMSHSIACSLASSFRAVAIQSGNLLSGCAGGTDPVAYYIQHGVSDSVLPITGGRSLRDTFVKNNGCTQQSPPEPAKGSMTHVLTKYEGCKEGYPVWWTAFDGDHTPTPVDGANSTDKDKTWTSKAIWEFFDMFQ